MSSVQFANTICEYPLGENTMESNLVELQGWREKLLKVISAITEDDEGYKDPIIATIQFAAAGKDMLLAWLRSIYKFVRDTMEKAFDVMATWVEVLKVVVQTVFEMLQSASERTYTLLKRLVNSVFGEKFPEAEAEPLVEKQVGGAPAPYHGSEPTYTFGEKVIEVILAFMAGIVSLISSLCDAVGKISGLASQGVANLSRLVTGLKNITPVDTLKRVINVVYFFFTGKNWFLDVVVFDEFSNFQKKYTYSHLLELEEEELKAVKAKLCEYYLEVSKYDANKFFHGYQILLKLIEDALADVSSRAFVKNHKQLSATLDELEKLKVVDFVMHREIANMFKRLSNIFDQELATSARFGMYSAMLKRCSERVSSSLAAVSAHSRIKPVVVCIRGASATGKTQTLKALIEDIPLVLNAHYSDQSPASVYGRYMFHAMCPSALTFSCMKEPEKFDSTYAHQMFVVFNELHTHVEPKSRVAWAEKFIAYIDDSPHNLQRAFADKGQVYMTSPFVFASGNFEEHTIVMQDADAHHRRIELDLTAERVKKKNKKDPFDPRVDVRYKFSPECIKILNSDKTPSKFISQAVRTCGYVLDYKALLDLVTGAYIARLHEDASYSTNANVHDFGPNQFSKLLGSDTSVTQFKLQAWTGDKVQLQVGDDDLVEEPKHYSALEKAIGNEDDWYITSSDKEGILYSMQHFLMQNIPYVVVTYGELYKQVRNIPFKDVPDLQLLRAAAIVLKNPFELYMRFTRSLFSLRRSYLRKEPRDLNNSQFRHLRRSASYIKTLYTILSNYLRAKPQDDQHEFLVEAYPQATPAQQKKINSVWRKREAKTFSTAVVSSVDGVQTVKAVERPIVYTTEQKVAYQKRIAANRKRGSAMGAEPLKKSQVAKVQPNARSDEYARRRRKRQNDQRRRDKQERTELQGGRPGPYKGVWIPNVYAHDKHDFVVKQSNRLQVVMLPPVDSMLCRGWTGRLYIKHDSELYNISRDKIKGLPGCRRGMSYVVSLANAFGIELTNDQVAKLWSARLIKESSFQSWFEKSSYGRLFFEDVILYALDMVKRQRSVGHAFNFVIAALLGPYKTMNVGMFPSLEFATCGVTELYLSSFRSDCRGTHMRQELTVYFDRCEMPEQWEFSKETITVMTTAGLALTIGIPLLISYALPKILTKSFEMIMSLFAKDDDVYMDQQMAKDLDALARKYNYAIVVSPNRPGVEPQVYFTPPHQMKGKQKDVLTAIRTKHGIKNVEIQNCMTSPVLAKIIHNQYVMLSEQGTQIASFFFIRSTVAIMNAHVYKCLPSRFTCVPYKVEDTGRHLNVFKADMQVVEMDGLADDTIALSIPNAMVHPDITKFLHNNTTPNSLGVFSEAYISFFDGAVSLAGDIQSVSDCQRVKGPQNLNSLNPTTPYILEDVVSYRWSGTRKATCGSLLLGYSGGQWYIIGLHTAGQPSGGKGFSTYLGGRKYIQKEPNLEQEKVELNSLFSIDPYEDSGLPGFIGFEEGEHVCSVLTSPYTPNNLVRTPYDPHRECPFAPAAIGRESYEIGLKKEKDLGSKGAERPSFPLLEVIREYKEEILERALPHWKRTIPTNLTRVDFDDVIDGLDGHTHFDTQSARGLRLQYLKIRKEDVFEKDHPSRKTVENLVAHYWKRADEERVFNSQVGHDKQKVEVRDLERVGAKKTRVFNITDFVDNVMMRQAVGPIVKHFPTNSVYGPMTCGIDPRSLAWTSIAKQFERFKRIYSFDVKGFEYIVTLLFINLLDPLICHAFPSWKDRIAAKWSFVSIIHALRFAFGKGRILYRGNTSGNWLTTWLNSFESACHFSVCTIVLALLHNDDPGIMLQRLKLKVYSDDNISALGAPWWTPKNITTVFMDFMGIELTATDKSAVSDSSYDTIHTIDFLGRRFRYENGVYYAPLNLESLLTQLYYVKVPKREIDNFSYVLSQLQINVDNVCSELAEFELSEAIRLRDEIGQKLRAMGTTVALTSTPMECYRKISNY